MKPAGIAQMYPKNALGALEAISGGKGAGANVNKKRSLSFGTEESNKSANPSKLSECMEISSIHEPQPPVLCPNGARWILLMCYRVNIIIPRE